MSRRVRRYLKAAASLIFLVLIAAACSSDGFPESYDAQVDQETGLSNVEANWLDGCTVGFEQSDLAEDANAVCACSYREIKASIPFADFVALNSDLKNDPSSLTTQVSENDPVAVALTNIVKDCIANS